MSRNKERITLENLIKAMRNRLASVADSQYETRILCDSIMQYQEHYKKRFGHYYHFREKIPNRNI